MFKNEYKITEDMVPEYIWAYWRHKHMSGAYIVLLAVIYLAAIAALLKDVFTGNLNSMDVSYIAVIAGCSVCIYWGINGEVTKERNRLNKTGKAGTSIITVINKDEIELKDITAKTTFKMKRLKKMVETKNLYLLIIDQKTLLPLRKDSFTKGTSEAFYKFMEGKCKIVGH